MNHIPSMRNFRVWPVILLTMAFLSAPMGDVRASGGSVDSTSAITTNIRGTEEPLERKASPLHHTGRALLAVPYAGLHVVSWPIVKGLQLNEQYMIVPRLAKLLYLNYEAGGLRTSVFFGFETNIGLGIVGLNAAADDWPVAGGELELSGGFLSADENLAAFHIQIPPRRFLRLDIIGQLENRRDRPFYGIGPHSPDLRFTANRRRILGEATASLRITNQLSIAVTGYGRSTKMYSATDDEPPVSGGFPEAFRLAERNQYLGLEGSFIYDTRNRGDYSTRGHLLRLAGGLNNARSKVDADYRHYEGELQTLINLYSHTRVLAVRLFAEGVDSRDPLLIPYTELPRLGGKTGFRGYNRYRFADRTSMLLSLDYRYPVTNRVQGFIFGEWGSVARKWDDLRLADIDPAFGIGLNLSGVGPPLVFHAAFSPEGYQVYFGRDTIFSNESRRLR